MNHNNHWSDCALHSIPALAPRWCDCNGVEHPNGFLNKLKLFILHRWLYHTGRA